MPHPECPSRLVRSLVAGGGSIFIGLFLGVFFGIVLALLTTTHDAHAAARPHAHPRSAAQSPAHTTLGATRAHHRSAGESPAAGRPATTAAVPRRTKPAAAPRAHPIAMIHTRTSSPAQHLSLVSTAPASPLAPAGPQAPASPAAPASDPLNAPTGPVPSSLTLGPSASGPAFGPDYPFAFFSLAALLLAAWHARERLSRQAPAGILPSAPHPPG
jgi:hypothetical protein